MGKMSKVFRTACSIFTVWFIASTFAAGVLAQTPEAPAVPVDPPVTTEPPPVQDPPPPAVPDPPVAPVDPPVDPVPPVDPNPPADPPGEDTDTVPPPEEGDVDTGGSNVDTDPEVDEGSETDETPVEDAESTPDSDPTPTEQPDVPDQLEVQGSTVLTIEPGQFEDVILQYTVGSDRQQTNLSANMRAADGSSLDAEWKLESVDRTDTAIDPNDPLRDLEVRLEITDATSNGDTVTTKLRITAPDHIEVPATLVIDLVSESLGDEGAGLGVNKLDAITVHASASVHAPTVLCSSAGEDVTNTWNCAFDTTHPDPVAMSVSADVPEGWQLMLNSSELTAEEVALDSTIVETGMFTIEGAYLVGCLDFGTATTSTLNVTFSYPSGDERVLSSELPLVFERPTPSFEVTDFSFGDVTDMEALETTGNLTIKYSDEPCGWQASIEFSELTSDEFNVENVSIEVLSVQGLEGATVTISDNTISIHAPEGQGEASSDEFTIELRLELPHLIPPGVYVISLITQFDWLNEL